MQEHSENYKRLLTTIEDQGLFRALNYAGEGDVAKAAIALNKKLYDSGYALTSYQVGGRGFERLWAVYKVGEERPFEYKSCFFSSNYFPNILNRKTTNCRAYRELCSLENSLIKIGLIKKM